MSIGVTMKTIAAAAGVTQATVSMSLANNPRIPATTRERILAIAQRLGYRPNPYISTLMRVRRQGRPLKDKPVLALVCALGAADGWREHPAATVRQQREGALERAALRGYRAQEFWLHRDGMTGARFSEMLHTRGIHGLLLSPMEDGAPPPALQWEKFAAVSLSVPLPALNVTTVCNDHYFSALQAVRECHRRGYRRPGLVMLRSHLQRFQGRWLAGCLVAPQVLAGLRLAKPLVIDDWKKDEPRLLRWLTEERPDVLLTANGDLLRAILQRRGWKIPGDVGLAWLACPEPDHAISGIWQNGRLIGATAIDALVGLVERHERGLPPQATTLMVEGVWNSGATLRPLPAE